MKNYLLRTLSKIYNDVFIFIKSLNLSITNPVNLILNIEPTAVLSLYEPIPQYGYYTVILIPFIA